jgi:[acyl-carrier-protein] S-malonyltransferase
MNQLTGPVLWTQTIKAMIANGANTFTEAGPGKVLQGLILKIDSSVSVNGVS